MNNKQRPIWIWLITIFYLYSAVVGLIIFYAVVISGNKQLPPQVYFELAQRSLLDLFLLILLYLSELAAAGLIFYLRKEAFYCFTTQLLIRLIVERSGVDFLSHGLLLIIVLLYIKNLDRSGKLIGASLSGLAKREMKLGFVIIMSSILIWIWYIPTTKYLTKKSACIAESIMNNMQFLREKVIYGLENFKRNLDRPKHSRYATNFDKSYDNLTAPQKVQFKEVIAEYGRAGSKVYDMAVVDFSTAIEELLPEYSFVALERQQNGYNKMSRRQKSSSFEINEVWVFDKIGKRKPQLLFRGETNHVPSGFKDNFEDFIKDINFVVPSLEVASKLCQVRAVLFYAWQQGSGVGHRVDQIEIRRNKKAKEVYESKVISENTWEFVNLLGGESYVLKLNPERKIVIFAVKKDLLDKILPEFRHPPKPNEFDQDIIKLGFDLILADRKEYPDDQDAGCDIARRIGRYIYDVSPQTLNWESQKFYENDKTIACKDKMSSALAWWEENKERSLSLNDLAPTWWAKNINPILITQPNINAFSSKVDLLKEDKNIHKYLTEAQNVQFTKIIEDIKKNNARILKVDLLINENLQKIFPQDSFVQIVRTNPSWSCNPDEHCLAYSDIIEVYVLNKTDEKLPMRIVSWAWSWGGNPFVGRFEALLKDREIKVAALEIAKRICSAKEFLSSMDGGDPRSWERFRAKYYDSTWILSYPESRIKYILKLNSEFDKTIENFTEESK